MFQRVGDLVKFSIMWPLYTVLKFFFDLSRTNCICLAMLSHNMLQPNIRSTPFTSFGFDVQLLICYRMLMFQNDVSKLNGF